MKWTIADIANQTTKGGVSLSSTSIYTSAFAYTIITSSTSQPRCFLAQLQGARLGKRGQGQWRDGWEDSKVHHP